MTTEEKGRKRKRHLEIDNKSSVPCRSAKMMKEESDLSRINEEWREGWWK